MPMGEILKINPSEPSATILEKAVKIIKEGGLVAFPTDTLYALACDIFNERAVKKVFKIKRRPLTEPLPIGISKIAEIYKICSPIPDLALKLLRTYSPGPLTIVLKKKRIIPSLITGGRDSVALRIPASPIALELIKRSKTFITLTSANLHKGRNPKTCEDVISELGEEVDLILDGGKTPLGKESTIIDFTKKPPAILREGTLKAKDLKEIIPDLVPLPNSKS